MRILHIVPYFYPSWRMGGTPRAVYELALAQRTLGHDLTIITTDIDSPGRALDPSAFNGTDTCRQAQGDLFRINHRGLEILYCRSWVTKQLSRLEIYIVPGFRRRLVALVRESPPDIIHAHEFRTGLTLAAASLAARHDTPLVISTHGSLFPPAPAWKTSAKRVFDLTVGRRASKRAVFFHALSDREAQDTRRLPGVARKVRVVPHGFNKPTIVNARKPLPFPAFLFLGRIHPIKGVEVLLGAWRLVTERYPQVSLLLLGREYRPHLRRLVSQFGLDFSTRPDWQAGKAVYGGYVESSIVADRLAHATCLVVPSLYEVWGFVVLEALAEGCPVVASEVCGCLEHLQDRSGVITVPPGDIQALASTISTVIENPPTEAVLPAMRSWEDIAKEMVALYARI